MGTVFITGDNDTCNLVVERELSGLWMSVAIASI